MCNKASSSNLVEDKEGMTWLSEYYTYSSNNLGSQAILAQNAFNATECLRCGVKETRTSQRVPYCLRKSVRSFLMNGLLPVRDNHFISSSNIVPRSCETNNITLRILII